MGEDRGDGGPGVSGAGVGGLVMKNGRGSGDKNLNWGVKKWKKIGRGQGGKKWVRRKNMGRGRGVESGGRGSRPPCPPPQLHYT